MTSPNDGFLELGCSPDAAGDFRYAVLPVPYEGTVTYLPGTAAGPDAIIRASWQVESFDEELLIPLGDTGITTLAPVEPADDPETQMQRVHQRASDVLAAGKFLLALGGEHSITVPMVRATAERHADLSVLQIDAHADLRDSYAGTKLSHACVMRRVLETTPHICQVGVRSFSRQEYTDCGDRIDRLVTPEIVRSDPSWIDRVLDLLTDTVYVTVDMDGFDPAVAPGVGTPEPGGLVWHEVTALLRRVCSGKRVVAADIVETRPLPANHITEFTAARLACKIIAYTQEAAGR